MPINKALVKELRSSFSHLDEETRCKNCGHMLKDHLDVCWGPQPDDTGMCTCSIQDFRPVL